MLVIKSSQEIKELITSLKMEIPEEISLQSEFVKKLFSIIIQSNFLTKGSVDLAFQIIRKDRQIQDDCYKYQTTMQNQTRRTQKQKKIESLITIRRNNFSKQIKLIELLLNSKPSLLLEMLNQICRKNIFSSIKNISKSEINEEIKQRFFYQNVSDMLRIILDHNGSLLNEKLIPKLFYHGKSKKNSEALMNLVEHLHVFSYPWITSSIKSNLLNMQYISFGLDVVKAINIIHEKIPGWLENNSIIDFMIKNESKASICGAVINALQETDVQLTTIPVFMSLISNARRVYEGDSLFYKIDYQQLQCYQRLYRINPCYVRGEVFDKLDSILMSNEWEVKVVDAFSVLYEANPHWISVEMLKWLGLKYYISIEDKVKIYSLLFKTSPKLVNMNILSNLKKQGSIATAEKLVLFWDTLPEGMRLSVLDNISKTYEKNYFNSDMNIDSIIQGMIDLYLNFSGDPSGRIINYLISQINKSLHSSFYELIQSVIIISKLDSQILTDERLSWLCRSRYPLPLAKAYAKMVSYDHTLITSPLLNIMEKNSKNSNQLIKVLVTLHPFMPDCFNNVPKWIIEEVDHSEYYMQSECKLSKCVAEGVEVYKLLCASYPYIEDNKYFKLFIYQLAQIFLNDSSVSFSDKYSSGAESESGYSNMLAIWKMIAKLRPQQFNIRVFIGLCHQLRCLGFIYSIMSRLPNITDAMKNNILGSSVIMVAKLNNIRMFNEGDTALEYSRGLLFNIVESIIKIQEIESSRFSNFLVTYLENIHQDSISFQSRKLNCIRYILGEISKLNSSWLNNSSLLKEIGKESSLDRLNNFKELVNLLSKKLANVDFQDFLIADSILDFLYEHANNFGKYENFHSPLKNDSKCVRIKSYEHIANVISDILLNQSSKAIPVKLSIIVSSEKLPKIARHPEYIGIAIEGLYLFYLIKHNQTASLKHYSEKDLHVFQKLNETYNLEELILANPKYTTEFLYAIKKINVIYLESVVNINFLQWLFSCKSAAVKAVDVYFKLYHSSPDILTEDILSKLAQSGNQIETMANFLLMFYDLGLSFEDFPWSVCSRASRGYSSRSEQKIEVIKKLYLSFYKIDKSLITYCTRLSDEKLLLGWCSTNIDIFLDFLAQFYTSHKILLSYTVFKRFLLIFSSILNSDFDDDDDDDDIYDTLSDYDFLANQDKNQQRAIKYVNTLIITLSKITTAKQDWLNEDRLLILLDSENNIEHFARVFNFLVSKGKESLIDYAENFLLKLKPKEILSLEGAVCLIEHKASADATLYEELEDDLIGFILPMILDEPTRAISLVKVYFILCNMLKKTSAKEFLTIFDKSEIEYFETFISLILEPYKIKVDNQLPNTGANVLVANESLKSPISKFDEILLSDLLKNLIRFPGSTKSCVKLIGVLKNKNYMSLDDNVIRQLINVEQYGFELAALLLMLPASLVTHDNIEEFVKIKQNIGKLIFACTALELKVKFDEKIFWFLYFYSDHGFVLSELVADLNSKVSDKLTLIELQQIISIKPEYNIAANILAKLLWILDSKSDPHDAALEGLYSVSDFVSLTIEQTTKKLYQAMMNRRSVPQWQVSALLNDNDLSKNVFFIEKSKCFVINGSVVLFSTSHDYWKKLTDLFSSKGEIWLKIKEPIHSQRNYKKHRDNKITEISDFFICENFMLLKNVFYNSKNIFAVILSGTTNLAKEIHERIIANLHYLENEEAKWLQSDECRIDYEKLINLAYLLRYSEGIQCLSYETVKVFRNIFNSYVCYLLMNGNNEVAVMDLFYRYATVFAIDTYLNKKPQFQDLLIADFIYHFFGMYRSDMHLQYYNYLLIFTVFCETLSENDKKNFMISALLGIVKNNPLVANDIHFGFSRQELCDIIHWPGLEKKSAIPVEKVIFLDDFVKTICFYFIELKSDRNINPEIKNLSIDISDTAREKILSLLDITQEEFMLMDSNPKYTFKNKKIALGNLLSLIHDINVQKIFVQKYNTYKVIPLELLVFSSSFATLPLLINKSYFENRDDVPEINMNILSKTHVFNNKPQIVINQLNNNVLDGNITIDSPQCPILWGKHDIVCTNSSQAKDKASTIDIKPDQKNDTSDYQDSDENQNDVLTVSTTQNKTNQLFFSSTTQINDFKTKLLEHLQSCLETLNDPSARFIIVPVEDQKWNLCDSQAEYSEVILQLNNGFIGFYHLGKYYELTDNESYLALLNKSTKSFAPTP